MILEEVEFLYKFYMHSLSSGGYGLLEEMLESRFLSRVGNFVEDMRRMGVDLPLSDNDQIFGHRELNFGRKVTRAGIKKRILEAYQDVELDIQYT